MKFLLLMSEPDHFARWDAASEAEQSAVFDSFRAFSAAVRERGELLVGEALAPGDEARTLRPGPDRPVTDGPYAETVEQVGGLYIVDLPDRDTAVDVARLLPRHVHDRVAPDRARRRLRSA